MSKRVAVVQSNYIPWKGYFDLIQGVDEFILLDDVQYTRRDWRNRNAIKTKGGLLWLTIPVQAKGKYCQKMNETVVSDTGWNSQHWATITHSYSKAPFFRSVYTEALEELYRNCQERYLSRVNFVFLQTICHLLGIRTKLSWSGDYRLVEGKTERLVSLCKQANASVYLSGPSARSYMDPEQFTKAGIQLSYFDYAGYPEYHQLFPPFEHRVSIIDLLLNEGPNASRYMKSFPKGNGASW